MDSPTQKRIEKVLLGLWNNDNRVPATTDHRCTELDWFSSGIKDNIVSFVAAKLLGIQEAEELLGIIINKEELGG